MSSRFSRLPEATPDAAFALIQDYHSDPSSLKVDLTPGFYRDADGKPWVLPSVQEVVEIPRAKRILLKDSTADHEHLPLTGHPEMLKSAQKLVFDAPPRDAARIASIQTVAGTGANHLAALFLAKGVAPRTVWISDPSWINHMDIWKWVDSGIDRQTYPYFDKTEHTVNFDGMESVLRSKAVEGDVLVLHACAHNPTGIDLSKDQWRAIARMCEEKGLIPLFDMAYQGLATGDLVEDAWAVRYFFNETSLELLVAQSFSKNFGLYGERVGALHVVCCTEAIKSKTLNILTRLSRSEITTAPINGARIVANILGQEDMKKQWQRDMLTMSDRMKLMRERLVGALRERQTPGSWGHLLTDTGMFSMTGLQPQQIAELREKHHIYLLPSGRLSFTGLTEHNVDYVGEAFHKVISAESLATGVE